MRFPEDSSTPNRPADGKSLGVLSTRRKPLQDSPTPAGNPMAAIALLRLHHYTGDRSVSRQGGADAGDFCRRGGAIWNFCRDLRDRGRPFLGESGAGGRDRGTANRRSRRRRLASSRGRDFRFQQKRAATDSESGGRGESSSGAGGYHSELAAVEVRASHLRFCVPASACQPPVTDPEELQRALESALRTIFLTSVCRVTLHS